MYNNPNVIRIDNTEVKTQLTEVEERLTAQLAESTTDFYNISRDLETTSDFSVVVSSALNKHDKVFVPKGTYILESELVVPEGKILDLGYSTLIFSSNEASVVLNRSASLFNYTLDTRNVSGFSGIALRIDGGLKHSTMSQTETYNGYIYGSGTDGGTGLFLDCTKEGSAIVNAKIGRLRIRDINTGIRCDSTLPGTYINSNLFDGITFYNCETFIKLDGVGGSGADNNILKNISIQPTSNSKTGLFLGGHRNLFEGTVWDVGHFPEFTNVFEFSSTARENIINTQGGQNRVVNNNGMNTINGNYGGIHPNILLTGAGKLQSPDTRLTLVNYIGNQDNVLANGDKKYTVTVEGAQASRLADAFSTNPSTYATWSSLTPEDIIKINIDMSNDPLRYGTVIGCMFPFMMYPDYVKIEIESHLGDVKTILEEDGFTGGYVMAFNDLYEQIKRITFTFKKYNGTRIDISKFFAGAMGTKGNHFIDTSGGNIYGNLSFSKGNGVVFTSPDGNIVKKIGIDNEGNIIATDI